MPTEWAVTWKAKSNQPFPPQAGFGYSLNTQKESEAGHTGSSWFARPGSPEIELIAGLSTVSYMTKKCSMQAAQDLKRDAVVFIFSYAEREEGTVDTRLRKPA